MREVRAAALRELGSWARLPLFWWLLAAAPMLAILVLSGLFGEGALRDLPVAVCDLDRSRLSREWIREADGLSSIWAAEAVASPLEGLEALRRGRVHGVLIVPRHFERDMLRSRAAQPVCYLDGQRLAVGSVLRRDLTSLGSAFWEKHHTDAMERAGAPPRAARELSATLSLDVRSPGNPFTGYGLFLVHGFLPVLMQLVSLIYLTYRLKSLPAPVSAGSALGTVLPGALWAWLLCCAAAGALRQAGAMTVECPLAALCGLYLAFMAVCACLALFIAGLCDDRLQALMFVSGLASPAFAFSGVTFPLESMPPAGRFWAGLLPSTHLLKMETAMAQMNAPASDLLPSLAALLALALLYGAGGGVFHALRRRRGAGR